jgi:hypothetical protein
LSAAQVRIPESSAAVAPLGRLSTGRIIAGLVTLFLLFDAAMKLVKPAPVVQAFPRPVLETRVTK